MVAFVPRVLSTAIDRRGRWRSRDDDGVRGVHRIDELGVDDDAVADDEVDVIDVTFDRKRRLRGGRAESGGTGGDGIGRIAMRRGRVRLGERRCPSLEDEARDFQESGG